MTVVENAREQDRAALRDWAGIGAFVGDELIVAREGETVVAALAWRAVAPDEGEILYLETDPGRRRHGFAKALLLGLLNSWSGTLYLEVRESNDAALELYRKCGFTEAGRRAGYYSDPVETAIVLKICSC